jgi:outer membrane protein OmpA-like peptidoglycan-associated protein
MASPQQRAVAPGTQLIRADNVKAQSWINPTSNHAHIGQIFFATDDATLDSRDMALLDDLCHQYEPEVRKSNGPFVFRYFGYADYRHTKEHNYDLSKLRAQAVADHVGANAPTRLGGLANYRADVRGLGVDYNGINRPPNSKDLEEYRRVDIIAPNIKDPDPVRPDPPDRPPRSTHWQARLLNSQGGSVGPIQGDRLLLEIVDLKNKLGMVFRYVGGGVGKGPKSRFPGGSSFSASPSNWVTFDVYPEVSITDFEGWATHTAGQLQVGIGGSFDLLILFGPYERYGCNGVALEFHDFTLWGKGMGLGASQTGGTLQPSGDNKSRPRPWEG